MFVLSIFRQRNWRTGRMNTSEKEFQMIYFLINLSTLYIFQEICPITRTWRLQDIFQGLTKDLTILSLYQWLKKSYRFIFFNKKNTPAGCWQELKKFAKNWTFARRWSWQCKLNWVFLFDTAFVNSTNISTILRRRWGLWNPGWEGVHYYFEWRV